MINGSSIACIVVPKATMEASSASTSPSPLPLLVPSLPDDVTLHCVARIPRSHHFILSSISKSFKSLLCSPIFFSTRTLLRVAEPLLYLSIHSSLIPSQLYFTLIENPISLKYVLLAIPSPPTTPYIGSAFVPLGPKIYAIGGSNKDIPSAKVWVLDCRFNTWEAITSMHIGREFPAAGVVDGKIYVIGGCIVDNFSRSKYWAEVYDPKTGIWESVDSSSSGNSSFILFRDKWMHASAVINDRIYAMADRNGVVYDPKNGKWGGVETELDSGWRGRGCVIDNVLYCYDYLGKIKCFDKNRREWTELKGLEEEEELPTFLYGAAMANLGGKLAVLWEGSEGNDKGVVNIHCAVIALKKKGDQGELWGNIEWCDVVHVIPRGGRIVHCAAVTL